jgi:1,4-alpha-glucan branching enzyme
MKNSDTRNAKGGGPALELVRFDVTHRGARTVCVAGTFNGWHPAATPMIPSHDGRWLKELVLPPGTHEYCLVVDGKWMADSLANEMVPNLFGKLNSVLQMDKCA